MASEAPEENELSDAKTGDLEDTVERETSEAEEEEVDVTFKDLVRYNSG